MKSSKKAEDRLRDVPNLYAEASSEYLQMRSMLSAVQYIDAAQLPQPVKAGALRTLLQNLPQNKKNRRKKTAAEPNMTNFFASAVGGVSANEMKRVFTRAQLMEHITQHPEIISIYKKHGLNEDFDTHFPPKSLTGVVSTIITDHDTVVTRTRNPSSWDSYRDHYVEYKNVKENKSKPPKEKFLCADNEHRAESLVQILTEHNSSWNITIHDPGLTDDDVKGVGSKNLPYKVIRIMQGDLIQAHVIACDYYGKASYVVRDESFQFDETMENLDMDHVRDIKDMWPIHFHTEESCKASLIKFVTADIAELPQCKNERTDWELVTKAQIYESLSLYIAHEGAVPRVGPGANGVSQRPFEYGPMEGVKYRNLSRYLYKVEGLNDVKNLSAAVDKLLKEAPSLQKCIDRPGLQYTHMQNAFNRVRVGGDDALATAITNKEIVAWEFYTKKAPQGTEDIARVMRCGLS